jgi:hypothetical protein
MTATLIHDLKLEINKIITVRNVYVAAEQERVVCAV